MVFSPFIHNAILFSAVVGALPLSFISRRIPNLNWRKFYHLFVGVVFCFLLYQRDFLYVAFGQLLVYFIMYLPGRWCLLGILIPISGIGFIHWKRLGNVDEWRSDISGLIMFSSIRLWTTIFNIFDGRRKVERPQWKYAALEKVPSLFDFYVYLYNFIGLFSGPVVPLKAFLKVLEVNPKDDKENKSIKKDSLLCLGKCLFFGVCYGVCMMYFPNQKIISEPFQSYNYFIRFFYSVFFSFEHTTRYIFAWLGAEAGFIYMGCKLVEDFDTENFRSFRPKEYFSVRTVGDLTLEWNRSVHVFLKEYLHVRVISIGWHPLIAKLLTFLFSAYWHGFYPGYYIYAFLMVFISIIDQYRIKWTTPLFEKLLGKKIAFLFDCIWTQSLNYYASAGWDLLWFSHFLTFNKNMMFLPYVFEVLLVIIGYQARPYMRKNKKE